MPPVSKPLAHHRKPLKCRKGFRKKQVHGKARCARVKAGARHSKRSEKAKAGIIVGQGAVGVSLGNSKQQVLNTLGKPFRTEPTFLAFPKPCLCTVDIKRSRVSAIDVFAKSQQTDRGVSVGTSYEKTTAAYPEAKCYHPAVYGETSRYCVIKSQYKGRSVKTTFAFFEKNLGVRDIEVRFG